MASDLDETVDSLKDSRGSDASRENPADATHNKREVEQTVRVPSLGRADALLDAVAAISEQMEVRTVAEEAAKQIVHFTDADIAAISRWDEIMGVVVLWAEYKHGQITKSQVPYLPYHISDYPTTKLVLQTSNPAQLHIDDPDIDEEERTLMEGMNAKSMLMLPLFAQERVIGLIEIFQVRSPRKFTQDEIAHVRVLAEHAGISLDRAVLYAKTKQRALELESVRQASLTLTASLDQDKVFTAIMDSALQLSPDAMDTHIFTYQDGVLAFGASLWVDGREGPAYKNVRKDGLTYSVARSGEVIVVEDASQSPLYQGTKWVGSGWKGSIIGLPLKTGDNVIGVLNIAHRTPQDFTEDRLRVLGLLSDQAAIAIVNVRLHNMVKLQARTDPLTGLANRRAFDERLDEEIRRSNRYEHHFTLFMMDLDGFKRINDTFGHPKGDQALSLLGDCFLKTIRDTDFIARFGGDEFILILPETEREIAKNIADKLIKTVENYPFPWKSETPPLPLTLTIGMACYPIDARNAEDLITAADTALYNNKKKRT
ncbi:MAG: diguanylate cyclase [Anaerolineales bacterium]|jgi:diguanylate cyclase (GGDEF)-like protein